MIQTPENGKKPHFGPDLCPLGLYSKIFKNLSPPVSIYHYQLSSCTTLKKVNDPILENLVMDGRTDGRTRLKSSVQRVNTECPRGALKTFCIYSNNIFFYKKLHFLISASSCNDKI